MSNLYVKLTDASEKSFVLGLPSGVARFKGDEYDTDATLSALKSRVEDKEDVLSFGDLSFDLIGADERAEIQATNAEIAEKLAAEIEYQAASPDAVALLARKEAASAGVSELNYVSNAEAILTHEALIRGEGQTVMSDLFELTRKQDKVIRSGLGYPTISNAVTTVIDRDAPETAILGLAAALSELGLGE